MTEVNTLVDLNLKASGDLRYCLATLWTTQNGADAVVGGLVLGFRDRSPRLPSAEVLRAIAAHLAHAVSEESSVSSWLKT